MTKTIGELLNDGSISAGKSYGDEGKMLATHRAAAQRHNKEVRAARRKKNREDAKKASEAWKNSPEGKKAKKDLEEAAYKYK